MTRIALMGTWLLAMVSSAVTAAGPALADPQSAGSYPQITASAWAADPQGGWSPDQAMAQAWTPYHGILARGYTEDTTWLRLRINPGTAAVTGAAQRLVLFIEPPQLDQVTVYLADRLDEPLKVVGDTVWTAPGQRKSLAHIVALPDRVEPFEVLLQVRNRSSTLLNVQVLRWEDALARDTGKLLRVVAFLVFIGVVALLAGFAWIDQRDAVLGLFFAHQLAAMLLVSTIHGLVHPWIVPWLLSPRSLDVLTSYSVPLYTGLTVLLHIQLLRDLGAREPDRHWLPLGLVPSALGVLVMTMGFRPLGLLITHSMVPVLLLAFMVAASRCRVEGDDTARNPAPWRRVFIVGAYALMAALTVPQSLRLVGLLSGESSNFDFLMFYAFISTLLMAGLLRIRAADRERRRGELARALEESRQATQVQRALASEQSELLTMLAHELKTPLSVVSLALGDSDTATTLRERANRAVRAMRDVIDRCTQIAYFDDDASNAGIDKVSEPMDPAELVTDVVALHAEAGRVSVNFLPGLPTCHTDQKLLGIILGNLLDNALKYSPSAASVRLTLAAAERHGQAGVLIRIENPPGRAGSPRRPTDLGRGRERCLRIVDTVASMTSKPLTRVATTAPQSR